MAVFVVCGELGSGKSLQAVAKIRDALQRGRPVATNMDIRLEKLVTGRKPRDLRRLPDWPTYDDLARLGKAYEGPFDEKKFGLIVLDEMATFLNSREWSTDKGRLKMINWLRHARKMRWHLILLSQDIESLDKQVRAALAEHVVKCKRMDRFAVPVISTITKLLGLGAVRMPQVHLGVVRYGTGLNAPVVDRWWLPDARLLHGAYDTEQKIMGENDGPATMLDARHAPYLWAPGGIRERLWSLLFWRWLPPSEARAQHDAFRTYESLHLEPVARQVSYLSWLQRMGPELPTRAAGGFLA